MKYTLREFLCRLFFYVLAVMFLNTAFGSWPESDDALFYLAHYGPRFVSYISLFEAGYQVAAYIRRRRAIENAPTAELDCLETNRLDKK